eukprot:TRINITY_DN811_c0_g3_i1.p3 TRINITY_DN811_c0_g3~~TRINITY_DN811_c0_g3_i1.p3  ORF type:complete len:159 (-),score=11.26 TRINITY_DN811_c0_g3_i1:32-508(-)
MINFLGQTEQSVREKKARIRTDFGQSFFLGDKDNHINNKEKKGSIRSTSNCFQIRCREVGGKGTANGVTEIDSHSGIGKETGTETEIVIGTLEIRIDIWNGNATGIEIGNEKKFETATETKIETAPNAERGLGEVEVGNGEKGRNEKDRQRTSTVKER